jgi:hypothetical protein
MLPWAVTLLVWLNAPPSRAEEVPCIRLADPGQQRLLVQGLTKSPTFARVAAGVCRTDAIVYVELSHTMRSAVAGTCQLVVTTPANRFLRIYLNARVLNGAELISVLGHELEHAGEIGRAPWVREPDDVTRLQRTLAPGRAHSPEADRVGMQVLREVLTRRRAPSDPGWRMAGRATDERGTDERATNERATNELSCGRAGDGPCTGSAEGSILWRGLAASNHQGRTSSVLR